MAKGRGQGHNRKKDPRRNRGAGKSAGGQTPAPGATTAVAPHEPAEVAQAAAPTGLAATRGSVSAAYRAWAADYGRRQAQGVGAQYGGRDGQPLAENLFILAPLTARTVTTPGGTVISVQMGLPIGATRAGNVAVVSDRLAVTVLRIPEPDRGGALAMLGLGRAPKMPAPEALFATQLPAEGMRGVRSADAMAWYLARAVEDGDLEPEPDALIHAAGQVLGLVRPAAAPRGVARLDPAELDGYSYGEGTDEEAVPPDLAAAATRGGLAAIPATTYLTDDGAPLAGLLVDLRDYVVGLWPDDYFGLEALVARAGSADTGTPHDRAATLDAVAGLTRRLDAVLLESQETEAAALAEDGQPPAWIAQETARYREGRLALRSTKVAQELIPLLGPILFDLEIPPAGYTPPGSERGPETDGEEDEYE